MAINGDNYVIAGISEPFVNPLFCCCFLFYFFVVVFFISFLMFCCVFFKTQPKS